MSKVGDAQEPHEVRAQGRVLKWFKVCMQLGAHVPGWPEPYMTVYLAGLFSSSFGQKFGVVDFHAF